MSQPETVTCNSCFSTSVAEDHCGACGTAQAEPGRDRRALPAGITVGRKYLLGRVLGAGGFGITYLAHDQSLHRRVALKEYFPNGLVSRVPGGKPLSCHSAEDEQAFNRGLDRFISEGRYLARFDHPNIVKVIELFQENDTAYMAMEYLEGCTLKTLQQERGRFSERETLDVMVFVLDALRTTHAENVIHRDVKPDNIYLTRQGRTLLLDFGGAKQLAVGGERSVDTVFSPGYAAPEQYFTHSDDIGPWTDVYGCAATFFKLLTGRTPPAGMERFAKDQPLDWSGADVSQALKAAVTRAMRPRHQERFSNVAEFQAALPSLEAEPIPKPRSKALLVGAGVLAAMVAAGGLLWAQAGHEAVAARRDRVRNAMALEGLRERLSSFYGEHHRFPVDFNDLGIPAPAGDSEIRRVDLMAGEIMVELALKGLEGKRLQLRPTGVVDGRTQFECWALDLPEDSVPRDVCRTR